MRKLTSLLLSLLLVFALATTAFATQVTSGTNDNSGKITIDNAVKDYTYTIYEILYLESYNATSGAYAYKATDAWKDFVGSNEIKDVYLTTDGQGYVTWVQNASAADFAAAAKKYAEDKRIANQGTQKAGGSTVEFTGLNLGYYLVDSTLGALCSLDSTNPNVTIKEKNGTPTLGKEVQEDSNNAWGNINDADIGQTVNFKATINVIDGQPKNYVMHDTMSSGLTFVKTSVKVTVNDKDSAAYTLVENLTDGCTFEIQFTEPKPNDVIVVTYSATVNSSAVIGLDGNTNKAKLSYTDTNGTSHNTTEVETKTYTWDMDVLKYANGDEKKPLQGVKFVLLNSDKTKVAKVSGGKLTGWVDVSTITSDDTTTRPTESILTTDANGKIEIDGLDADTYYLREIEALPGFNILSGDQEVKIDGATKAEDSDTLTYTTQPVKINNQSGTELPSTGGMGTTIFYILGSVLVLAAGVLLVTKKRMSAEN